MKSAIVCFSQSGNTHKIAAQIQAGIQERSGHCDLLDLTETSPDSLQSYDLVGLGCPVFYYKEPAKVSEFIHNMPDADGRAAFVFCTHGAVPGTTIESLWRQMRDKGFSVLGAHNTYADIAVPFYPKPALTGGHPDQQDHDEARAFGNEIAELARQFQNGELTALPRAPHTPDGWWIEEARSLTPGFLAQVMPTLLIDTDKCIQCLACEDACPVHGINAAADPPILQEPCIYCFHCVKTCPQGALGADWGAIVSMAPANFARYRKALNEAAAAGRFRWLIDPDTVDCANPLHLRLPLAGQGD